VHDPLQVWGEDVFNVSSTIAYMLPGIVIHPRMGNMVLAAFLKKSRLD
jgi:hypothetical protein